MCGIFCSFCKQECKENYNNFRKLQHRGPDMSSIIELRFPPLLSISSSVSPLSIGSPQLSGHIFLGFHRLAINDISNGNQPFLENGIYLLCNGEIYNHLELELKYDLKTSSKSDCECILKLYQKIGIEETVKLLDGDFAFVIYNTNTQTVHFARDRFGVRPLFVSYTDNGLVLCSEAKGYCFKSEDDVLPLVPRYIYTYDILANKCTGIPYYTLSNLKEVEYNLSFINKNIKMLLEKSIKKRLESQRDIGVFLSGGLDSSLILSILIKLLYEDNDERTIDVFSIGNLETSPDIKNAQIVTEYLKHKYGNKCINHHIISFTPEMGVKELENVVKCCESYDTTTIRASIPMYIMSKYVKENTNVKVIFSGEGADELFGGYLYFHMAPDNIEFKKESIRLLNDIFLYDGLRIDRTTAAFGLEVRVPYLDRELTDFVLSIKNRYIDKNDIDIRLHQEKALLRTSFYKYLPEEILFLKKNALSDAVGSDWREKLKEYCQSNLDFLSAHPDTDYIRVLFNEMYSTELITYYWLPKWIDTKGESSAMVFYESIKYY